MSDGHSSSDHKQVTVVAPNPDVVKKAQIFRHGLMEMWGEDVGEDGQCEVQTLIRPICLSSTLLNRTSLLSVIYYPFYFSFLVSARRVQLDKPPRVGFAMFSRPPVVKGSVLQREAELLGDVAGADVVIVDEMVDTANTLLRVAAVLKVAGLSQTHGGDTHTRGKEGHTDACLVSATDPFS
jgi:phosphoribosylpyrophosphate synthetase